MWEHEDMFRWCFFQGWSVLVTATMTLAPISVLVSGNFCSGTLIGDDNGDSADVDGSLEFEYSLLLPHTTEYSPIAIIIAPIILQYIFTS